MQIQPTLAIGAAATTVSPARDLRTLFEPARPIAALTALAKLTVTTAGSGTAVKVYVQTSPDGGTTWCDTSCLTFTTTTATKVATAIAQTAVTAAAPTDGTLADNTNATIFGNWCRVKIVSTGTYTTASLTVDIDVR